MKFGKLKTSIKTLYWKYVKLGKTVDFIKLNSSIRELKQKHISFNQVNVKPGDSYRVEGEICVRGEDDVKKAAIFSVAFYDESGKQLISEFDQYGLNPSQKYGLYRYLQGDNQGERFEILFTVPTSATRFRLRITAKNEEEPLLLSDSSIKKIKLKNSFDISSAISSLDKEYKNKPPKNLQQLENFMVSKMKSNDKSFVYSKVFEFYLNANSSPEIAAFVGWLAWRESKSEDIRKSVQAKLTFLGRMTDTKAFLDEVEASGIIKNKTNLSRRISDELDKLHNGFPYPEVASEMAYEPKKQTLYLLHNCLPYNSGGYATRTHGLLQGVMKNSDWKVQGVSRPGYPKDHKKHISKPLPEPIPLEDNVDGVIYFRCSQDVRKSSMTLTEYVEFFASEVEEFARANSVSIIHAASNFPNGLAANLAAKRLGIRSVYEVRGLWEITRMSRQKGWDKTEQFKYMAKMEAEACNGADQVLALTGAVKDIMVSRGVDENKITVVPNCVHTDKFKPLEPNIELSSELGIESDEVVIGYIGSIVNYEGLDLLLYALKSLLDQGVTNFKFLLVGDGAEVPFLKSLITQLELESKVILTGRVPHSEVQKYYSLVDITPFPRKPFLVCEAVSPLKPFEAMASQKAVLVSSCSALTEIVQHEETGLVFEKGNVEDLADKLKQYINSQELRSTLSVNGYNWVRAERDWSNSSAIVKKLYGELYNDLVS